MLIVGGVASAGVFLGALARVAFAIFTFTIRITALVGFFTHISLVCAVTCACSRTFTDRMGLLRGVVDDIAVGQRFL